MSTTQVLAFDKNESTEDTFHVKRKWKEQYRIKILRRNLRKHYLISSVEIRQEILDEIKKLNSRIDELEGTKTPKSKGDIIYDKLKNNLEQKYWNKVVAIDINAAKVVGIGKSFDEAYKNAISKTDKKKFYFKRVGFDYLESL